LPNAHDVKMRRKEGEEKHDSESKRRRKEKRNVCNGLENNSRKGRGRGGHLLARKKDTTVFASCKGLSVGEERGGTFFPDKYHGKKMGRARKRETAVNDSIIWEKGEGERRHRKAIFFFICR